MDDVSFFHQPIVLFYNFCNNYFMGFFKFYLSTFSKIWKSKIPKMLQIYEMFCMSTRRKTLMRLP